MVSEERKLKVQTPTGTEEVELAYPSGGDVKKGFQMYLSLLKLQGEISTGDPESGEKEAVVLGEYLEHVDSMSARAIGKTVEWLDSLSDEDKNQITTWYDERVKKRADFMRSSANAQT